MELTSREIAVTSAPIEAAGGVWHHTEGFTDTPGARPGAVPDYPDADLVHAHSAAAALEMLASGEMPAVPLVCTIHASDLAELHSGSPGSMRRYRDLFSALHTALATSGFVARKLREAGWNGPIELLPLGSWAASLPRRVAPPPRSTLRVVYSGPLENAMGVDVLLHALRQIDDPKLRLTIIGRGPRRGALERLARTLGVDAACRFQRDHSREALTAALESAHLLVQPGLDQPAGGVEDPTAGLKAAMAAGVPVVASASDGTAEVMAPPFRGELVAPGQSGALAEAMVRVLEAPGSWDTRSQIGHEWASQEFDPIALGERRAEIYDRIRARWARA